MSKESHASHTILPWESSFGYVKSLKPALQHPMTWSSVQLGGRRQRPTHTRRDAQGIRYTSYQHQEQANQSIIYYRADFASSSCIRLLCRLPRERSQRARFRSAKRQIHGHQYTSHTGSTQPGYIYQLEKSRR